MDTRHKPGVNRVVYIFSLTLSSGVKGRLEAGTGHEVLSVWLPAVFRSRQNKAHFDLVEVMGGRRGHGGC